MVLIISVPAESVVDSCQLHTNLKCKGEYKNTILTSNVPLSYRGKAFEPGCFIVIGEEVPKWNNPA